MYSRPLLICLAALLLAGCVTEEPQVRKAPPSVPPLENLAADAARAVAAGQPEQALSLLRRAAGAYPAEKSPWLAMAQLQFDRASFAEAIGHAQEALQRDPSDPQGQSIVAISGLRLSARALADLNQQKSLSPSLRGEAQELARTVRASLGEEAAPQPQPLQSKRVAPPRSGRTNPGAANTNPGAKPAAAPQGGNADPFGALK